MTWVAVAIIAIIVVLYLLIISVLEGFKAHYMDNLQSILAHTTARVGNVSSGMVYPERWGAELEKIPGVRGVTAGLEVPAIMLSDKYRTIGTLRGVDLDRELKYGRLKEILNPKGIDEFTVEHKGGRDRQSCIVGDYWRREFNLKVGDTVTFVFSAPGDDIAARGLQFKIIGFYEAHNSYLEMAAYVDRTFLADELHQKGQAKTLSLWVEGDPDRPDLDHIRDQVYARLRELMDRDLGHDPHFADVVGEYKTKLIVETWREKDSNFYAAISRENLIMRFIMAIFLFFIAIIVMLILGRLVAEKTREIGTLRALGATPGGIIACFLMQGFVIAFVGLLIGLPLGAAAALYVNNLEAWASDFVSWLIGQPFRVFPSSDYLLTEIPVRMLPFDFFLISALTLGSCVLGAFLPAWRAGRANPVECLRHE